MVSYFSSPIGPLKITACQDHISSINFMEEDVPLVETPSHPLLGTCLKQLEEYFAGERQLFDFPTHQRGTSFQLKVWQGLQTIPYGKTASYLALARQLGDVKAVRAVGTANGKNNLAIIVPCHRVIGSNQKLTGYAGGLWRKQWLLEHEVRFAHGVVQLFKLPV